MNPRLEARILRFAPVKRPYGEWRPTRLAAPIHASETAAIARATSITAYYARSAAGSLSYTQAAEIVAWHERNNQPPERVGRMRRFFRFIMGKRPTTTEGTNE